MGEFTVHLQDGVPRILAECLARTQHHQRSLDEATDEGDLIARQREVIAQQNSLLRGLIASLLQPCGDGDLRLSPDFAPLSLFWSYTSGYHGGLIFHPKGEGPQGTWSIHT